MRQLQQLFVNLSGLFIRFVVCAVIAAFATPIVVIVLKLLYKIGIWAYSLY